MRRTGGTSVTRYLSEVLPCAPLMHEPFHPARAYGMRIAPFLKRGDHEGMRGEITACLSEKRGFKHCFDHTHIEVTKEIIRQCADRGYRVLLLTRRDNAQRLLSLALAEATGIWSAREAQHRYPQIVSGALKPTPLSVDALRQAANLDLRKTGLVLSMLRYRNVPYIWSVYEELFHSSKDPRDQAKALAAQFGCDVSENDPALQMFLPARHQKSADIGPYVPGYEDARKTLIQICAL